MAKLKNLYDVNSIKDFCDTSKSVFSDEAASGGLLLAQQLKYISPNIFEKKYPDLVLLNSGITVNNEGGYNHTITSLREDAQGDFVEAKNRSDNAGRISLNIESSTIQVFGYKAVSDWSNDEIEAANLQNINLPARMISNHNKIYLRTIDRLGLRGTSISAIGEARKGYGPREGLLNYQGFISSAATGSHTTLTAQQNYDEIATLIRNQHAAVDNIPSYSANAVVMPISAYNYINTQPFNSVEGDGKSILAVLKINFPDIQFYASARCDSDKWIDASSRTVAFSTNPESMVLRIPTPLNFAPVYNRGFTYHAESSFRYGGLDVLTDQAARILLGW